MKTGLHGSEMSAAIFIILFWLGFERVEVKRPTDKVVSTFRPPREA